MLGVEQVPIPLCAQVFGIDSITEETLAMYFESKKRSGGCEDVEVSILKDHGCAIVKCPAREGLYIFYVVCTLEKNSFSPYMESFS